MKRVIINADDFGLHSATNIGIVKGLEEGLITSASIMACGKAFDDAVSLVKKHCIDAVGVHLVLDEEEPILPPHQIPSLVTSDGCFLNRRTLLKRLYFSNRISLIEVEIEFRAQIERCLENGLSLSHLDSHGHVHVYPRIARLVARLAREYGIQRVRIPLERLTVVELSHFDVRKYINKCIVSMFSIMTRGYFKKYGIRYPAGFMGMLHGGKLNSKNLEYVFSRLPQSDVVEIMSHPGIADASLETEYQNWCYNWQAELDAMLSTSKEDAARSRSLKLISYSEI